MKIENTGIPPLAPKPTEKAEKAARLPKETTETEAARSKQDSVEMSESARLLAKARAALGNTSEADAERLALLKQQIASGDYSIQIGELARKIASKFFKSG